MESANEREIGVCAQFRNPHQRFQQRVVLSQSTGFIEMMQFASMHFWESVERVR